MPHVISPKKNSGFCNRKKPKTSSFFLSNPKTKSGRVQCRTPKRKVPCEVFISQGSQKKSKPVPVNQQFRFSLAILALATEKPYKCNGTYQG
jgi:hypothetical protein